MQNNPSSNDSTVSEVVPVCSECQHVFFGGVSDLVECCSHPANLSAPDRVTGYRRFLLTPEQLRINQGKCGPSGRWWQPQSRWTRLVRRVFG